MYPGCRTRLCRGTTFEMVVNIHMPYDIVSYVMPGLVQRQTSCKLVRRKARTNQHKQFIYSTKPHRQTCSSQVPVRSSTYFSPSCLVYRWQRRILRAATTFYLLPLDWKNTADDIILRSFGHTLYALPDPYIDDEGEGCNVYI